MVHDPDIMGLCGETKIANKTASWVTMIQVFEYFISHHLSKSFESVFGSVTCLPGCFCMYRIKAPKRRTRLLGADPGEPGRGRALLGERRRHAAQGKTCCCSARTATCQP